MVMFSKHKINWNLLAKNLAGEANEKEMDAISQWLTISPENRALFRNLKSDLKIMDTMNKRFDVDNAWDKLHDRIISHENIPEPAAEKLLKATKYGYL